MRARSARRRSRGGIAAPPTSTASNAAQRLGPEGVVEQADQLGGHDAGVAPPLGVELPARGEEGLREEAVGQVHRDGGGAGIQRPQQHLEAGDVVRRQREQPLAGAAEPGVGRAAADEQRRGGEHGPLRGAGRPRRADHDGEPLRQLGRVVRRHRRRWRRGGVGQHRGVAAQRLGEAGEQGEGGRAERHGERLEARHQWMWSRQSAGTRPDGPGTPWSAGREVGGARAGPSTMVSSP